MIKTPIEIIALITVIVVLIKTLFLIIKPKFFLKFSDNAFKKPYLMMIVYLVLFVIVGYFVLQELTIVHVAAVMLMTSLFLKALLVNYVKNFSPLFKQIYSKNNWIVIILVLLLAIWILLGLFG